MKKIICTTTLILFLLVAGSASAFAAPITTAAAPATAASPNPENALSQIYQLQQNVVDQLEAARLQQVLALIQAGQAADVEFAGMLQPAGGPGQWAVAGLYLGQPAAMVFDGKPVVGLHAHVRAHIGSDGTLEPFYVHTLTPPAGGRLYEDASDWMHADYGIHLGPRNPVQMSTVQVVANPRPAAPQHVQQPATPQQSSAPPPMPAQHPDPSQRATRDWDDCSHDSHRSGHH